MPRVQFRDHVWPFFLRDNAMRVFKLGRRRDPDVGIPYAGSVHDQREIDAVVRYFRAGPQALRSARTCGNSRLDSGSSENGVVSCAIQGHLPCTWRSSCSNLEPGDEVITSAVTFSTDIAPLVKAGVVPAFVDVEPDTYNVDVAGIAEMIGPRSKPVLIPNLIGNAPDWDAIRTMADEHSLALVEDSCDALGQLSVERPPAPGRTSRSPPSLSVTSSQQRGRVEWCA